MKRILNQAGDTIIEVLFAVVVLGLAITTGYGMASLSLKQGRQAQERSEALKLAESQLEHLKALASVNKTPTTDQPFCLNDTRSVSFSGYPGGSKIAALDADNLDKYPVNCVRNSSNVVDGSGLYHLIIDGKDSGNTRQFTVVVRWFSLSGKGKDELKVEYRVLKKS
jgi:Tfp pilus assembly protein PilV